MLFLFGAHVEKKTKNMEKVQIRATSLVRSIRHLPYVERLKRLNLPTLKYRRARGDMIEVYKILNGKYDINACVSLITSHSVTRGNRYRLQKGHIKYDLRKYFFTQRIVDVWNSLPDYVVCTDTVDKFKNALDKWWRFQDLYFDYESDLTGIGSRSKCLT